MINCSGAGEVLSFIAPTRPPAVLAGACSRFRNVRLWHKADMQTALTNVRFEGNNGHDADMTRCLLMTHFGHWVVKH